MVGSVVFSTPVDERGCGQDVDVGITDSRIGCVHLQSVAYAQMTNAAGASGRADGRSRLRSWATSSAFVNVFERRAGYPRFSRKQDQARFRIPRRVRGVGRGVQVPKLEPVRLRLSRPVEGQTDAYGTAATGTSA